MKIKKMLNNKTLEIEVLESREKLETIGHHRHEYYEIFIILDGIGYHSIDFENYLMSQGKVFLMKPGQVHNVNRLPAKMYAISFNAEAINNGPRGQALLNKLFSHCQSVPFVILNTNELNKIIKILNIIKDELVRDIIDYEMIDYLFAGSMRLLYKHIPEIKNTNVKDDRILYLYSLIDENFSEHKDADFYSKELSIGKKRLNQITKQHLRKTVTQIIHEKIITESKRKLAFTNSQVKAISIDMGFKDLGYFCRFYKKHTGESPKEFRDNWLVKSS